MFMFLVTLLVGCPTPTNHGNDTSTTCDESNEGCVAGECGGEGAQMLPGADCIACHTDGGGEGGSFSWAGTIFTDLDGTAPAPSVLVRITDAEGTVFEETSNAVGNFYANDDLVFPIQAELEANGTVQAMTTPVSTGACSSCHLCAGAAGGKLYAP